MRKCHQMTHVGCSKVSCDIFLRNLEQNFLVLTTSWATFEYEIKQILFDLMFHTLSQIQLVLLIAVDGLGFYI